LLSNLQKAFGFEPSFSCPHLGNAGMRIEKLNTNEKFFSGRFKIATDNNDEGVTG
jgi:hypothetical protein